MTQRTWPVPGVRVGVMFILSCGVRCCFPDGAVLRQAEPHWSQASAGNEKARERAGDFGLRQSSGAFPLSGPKRHRTAAVHGLLLQLCAFAGVAVILMKTPILLPMLAALC